MTGTSYLGSVTLNADNITVNNVVSKDGNLSFFNSSGSEKMRITAGGNVGIGTTPVGFHSSYTGLQVGGTATWFSDTTRAAGVASLFTQNAHIDTDASWEYIVTDEASYYAQVGGKHTFYTAVSGTAGNDITFGDAKVTILNGGNVG
ncbi:MAG: hypothetical protein QF362_04310, partial [Candidatus Woesearchaeota archaeon]|nr:hypothetical protein [Candidatus Woesearchaeota archaeon]